MTNRERVLALLRSTGVGLTDAEIRQRTGIKHHQQVNQICRSLAKAGIVKREKGSEGLLINRLAATTEPEPNPETGPTAPVAGSVKLSEVELDSALIVIPCSGRKRRGGVALEEGASIVDRLPDKLANELLEARERASPVCRLDESETVPAVERYTGTLYEAATGIFQRLDKVGAEVVIVSGGYGIVLGGESIGWYSQNFDEQMWPDKLVARCLGAYADATRATTVIGLFGRSTSYARVFRQARWPATVERAWLISPEVSGGGAQVKTPRATGEALVEIATSHGLPGGWRSSDGVPVRVVEANQRRRDGDGLQYAEPARARELTTASRTKAATRPYEVVISLDERKAERLEAARVRFVAKLAGVDRIAGRQLEQLIDRATFATYLVQNALDCQHDGED